MLLPDALALRDQRDVMLVGMIEIAAVVCDACDHTAKRSWQERIMALVPVLSWLDFEAANVTQRPFSFTAHSIVKSLALFARAHSSVPMLPENSVGSSAFFV